MSDLKLISRVVNAFVSVCKDVKFEVMGEHYICAAVEAVLHLDRSADEATSGQVPYVHCPRSDGAANSISASRGSQTSGHRKKVPQRVSSGPHSK